MNICVEETPHFESDFGIGTQTIAILELLEQVLKRDRLW